MLYTRKGDKGTTKFLDSKQGERISKSSCRTEALGALDELNSYLGLCKVKSEKLKWKIDNKTVPKIIQGTQENIFIIQAEVAGADKTIKASKIGELETYAGEIEEQMPPIKSFFVPGSTELGAMFDVARTIARKAERRVVAAMEQETKVGDNTLAYLNRLSSLFYALARLTSYKSGKVERPPTYE